MNRLIAWVKSLFGKQQQVVNALDELADLPAAVENLRGVVIGFRSLDAEMKKALEDGQLSKSEQKRIEGRLSDLVASASALLNEIYEAVEAVKPLMNLPDPVIVAPTA